MRWLALLLLLPGLSQAAISWVDENTDVSASATSATPTEPTGAAENDVIVCFASIAVQDGAWTDPADFTEIDNNTWGAGSSDHTYLGYKIRGADAGSGYAFSYSGTAAQIRATCYALRSASNTQPDTTYNGASHYVETNDDAGATACGAVTTTTDGAWVMLHQFIGADGSFTQGVPSGYTARADHQVVERVHQIASKEVTSAGTETPGAWTHTDVAASADSACYTLSIRPASAGASDALYRRRR